MADLDGGVDEAALAVVARHALHDEELVAALAADGLDDDAELARARSFVERCTACRALHDDVAAIGSAIKLEATGTIAAPRDFRLTVDDARRLGGTVVVGALPGRFRRWVASFGRPIGASMAALGIVGLLVGSVSFGVGAAGTPSLGAAPGAAGMTAAPAEVDTGSGDTSGPKASERTAYVFPGASGSSSQVTNESPRDSASTSVNPVVWLLAVSALLLVGGIGLLVVAIRRNP